MRAKATVMLAGLLMGVGGCVSDPLIHRIRVRPTIADVETRVVSFQLFVPWAEWHERVIYKGVFTASYIEASTDRLEDFSAGDAFPSDLEKGSLKLFVQEAGQTHVIQLPRRAGGQSVPRTLYVSVTVPVDLSRVEGHWMPDEREGQVQPARAD